MDAKAFRDLFCFEQLETHKKVVEVREKSNRQTPNIQLEWGDSSVLVSWTPGNGTKYRVLFTSLSENVGKPLGCGADSLLVTSIPSYTSYPVQISGTGGIFHESYVAEKLGLRIDGDTCQAVAAVVNCGLNSHNSSYGAECINRVLKYA